MLLGALPATWSHQVLTARLNALPAQVRVAVAAACAQHVLPLYECFFDEGIHDLGSAVSVAWRFACGEGLAGLEVMDAVRAARDILNEEQEEEGTSPARIGAAVCEAVSYLLSALEADALPLSEERAEQSIRMAHAAVVHFARYEDGYEDVVDEWGVQEQQWQERVLCFAEKGAAPAAVRAFVARDDTTLGWSKRVQTEYGDPHESD